MKRIKKIPSDKNVLISFILLLLPIIIGIIFNPLLPEKMVTHINASGQPDGYSNKIVALFAIPISMAAFQVYRVMRIKNDPQMNYSKFFSGFWILLLPVLSNVGQAAILLYNFNVSLDYPALTYLFLGVLLIAAGLFLPKLPLNYTIGKIIPWSIADKENWRKTQHFTGKLWLVLGVFLIANFFFKQASVLYISLGISFFIPEFYSFFLYKKRKIN